MVRIRKANCLDLSQLKKMDSFLADNNLASKNIINFPYNYIQDLLPIKFKFVPESHVLEEDKNMLGMVTVSTISGNHSKLNIYRLFLEKNHFHAGKQLIDFVVAKYGAKGIESFIAKIEDSNNDLIRLFINDCGFRQCSSEKLWKMNTTLRFSENNNVFFRPFKNTDAQSIAMMFNDSLITHFKYSVSKTKNEYTEIFFKGLNDSSFKYVIEDKTLKTIKAYFSLTTKDNLNYVLDVTTSPWYDCLWEDILEFSVKQIRKRQKQFHLFVKVNKYTTTAENFENYLTNKGFKCIQNHVVLVKDFYKVIKDPQQINSVGLFNEINEKPVF